MPSVLHPLKSALPQGEAASRAQRLLAQTFPVPTGTPKDK